MGNLERTWEEIEQYRKQASDSGDFNVSAAYEKSMDIISNHMNDGWIPVEERLPEDDRYILLSFDNFSVPTVGRYEQDTDGGGNFYVGDEDVPCITMDLYVNAWRPLPEPYRPERSKTE